MVIRKGGEDTAMQWAISVLFLIMVAVIILANLGKAASQNQQRRAPRPGSPRSEDEPRPTPPPLPAPRAGRSPAEVERFLEEINRRRLEAAESRRRAAEAVRK